MTPRDRGMNTKSGLRALLVIIVAALAALLGGCGQASTISGNGPTSDAALDDFQTVSKVMDADPQHWAGAFMEDGTLIARYAGVTEQQARDALTRAGVSAATELRAPEASQDALMKAVDALGADRAVKPVVAQVGPDYQAGTVKLQITATNAAVKSAVTEIRDRFGVPIAVTVAPNTNSL